MHKVITEDSFFETYKPVKNPFDEGSSWGGCMFNLCGLELEHVNAVLKTDPAKVWTVLDCDGAQIVSSGVHLVNRMGFIITEVPVADGDMVETDDEDFPDDDDEDVDE